MMRMILRIPIFADKERINVQFKTLKRRIRFRLIKISSMILMVRIKMSNLWSFIVSIYPIFRRHKFKLDKQILSLMTT